MRPVRRRLELQQRHHIQATGTDFTNAQRVALNLTGLTA